jgi:hypothetical protein
MPFDPLKPATGSPLSSEEMREQPNALKALVDAVPAGPPGPVGPAFSTIQVGSVTTGTPGSPAGAQVNVSGNSVELSFTIPQRDPGSGVTSTDVTNAIANEISGTARNPSSVSSLSMSINNPPTQSDVQALMDKLNELIGALMR